MGKVFLVGAGPGDPELLTVKAARILGGANVVLHDGLVSKEILELVNPDAQVIDIGKRCGHKLLTQDEINALMIKFAESAKVVVRLKGGDPSVFGRAGEEISALTEAGVEFEIVPGITSALASAAAAKISLTDRRFASAVTLMTAHRGEGSDVVEWNRMVTSGATIAIYMPGKDYSELSAQLQSAGLDAKTPCAIVSSASRREQQAMFTTIAQLATCNPLPAPAHILVGKCANPLEIVDAEPRALALENLNDLELTKD